MIYLSAERLHDHTRIPLALGKRNYFVGGRFTDAAAFHVVTMKVPELIAVPPRVVTAILPVFAQIGTVAVI